MSVLSQEELTECCKVLSARVTTLEQQQAHMVRLFLYASLALDMPMEEIMEKAALAMKSGGADAPPIEPRLKRWWNK